jgi:glycosyltransferase involved in cell wall biosynthesis
MTGVGTASLLLLKALIQHGSGHEFHCLFLKGEKPDDPYPSNFIPRETEADYEKHPSGEWWLNFTLPEMLNRLKIDILHGTSFLIPWRKSRFCKVVTIHDLISYKYPEGYPFAFRNYIKSAIRFSARSADRIVASSENTRKDLQKLLNIDEKKISVVPYYTFPLFRPLSPVEKADQCKLLNLPEKFILNVGTLEPRKNQITLIRAFEILKRKTKAPHKLILIGQEGYKSNEILAEKERSPYSGEMHHIKNKTLSEMAPYYACADLFVFPSCYEGFGLPVLEAMSCGAPIVANKISSLPEVAGEAGNYYFPPESAENLADIMMELVLNPQRLESFRKKSLDQASRFSCEHTAKLLLNCYEMMG